MVFTSLHFFPKIFKNIFYHEMEHAKRKRTYMYNLTNSSKARTVLYNHHILTQVGTTLPSQST